jgi:methyl-accepting chemotaxis protein
LQQSEGVRQVSDALLRIEDSTLQNASLVEESAAAAESLQRQARLLVQAADALRLDHSSQLDAAVDRSAAPLTERPGADENAGMARSATSNASMRTPEPLPRKTGSSDREQY